MVASINGQADVIRVLLDAGADQTIEDRCMRSLAVHKAAFVRAG